MSMIAIAIIVVLTTSIAHSLYDRYHRKRKTLADILGSWGKPPSVSYRPGHLESIASYYHNRKAADPAVPSVDDITWNDLDMNDVFKRVNNTHSTIGEETLYALLRQPVTDPDELATRHRWIGYFSSQSAERCKIQYSLNLLGKNRQLNLTDYLFHPSTPRRWTLHTYLPLSGIAVISPLVLLYNLNLGIILIILSYITNFFIHYSRKAEIILHLEAYTEILRLIDCSRRVSKCKLSGFESYKSQMQSNNHQLKRVIKRISRLSFSNTGTLLDVILEYVKIFYLLELIGFEIVQRSISKYQHVLLDIYYSLGFIDAMISISSYRESLEYYCKPFFGPFEKGTGKVYLEDIYHPLIENPVPNSISIDKNILISGSNASGKSVFLKTIGVNAIFAQTIYTCLATRYEAFLFSTILSSMALRDNIIKGESYFIIEIKSIKRMLDYSNPKLPCLCIIDEILRGTNTVERISASSQVLKYLANSNCICIAATHDIELTFINQRQYRNMHFQENIIGGDVIFDYKIRDGRTETRNAIKLLSVMGYDEAIIMGAEKLATKYDTKFNKMWLDGIVE
jgi:DNA mismatch repair ATPase MutS